MVWGCVRKLGVGLKLSGGLGREKSFEGLTAGGVSVREELWDEGEGDMARRFSTSLSDFSSMSANPVSSVLPFFI